MMKGPVFSGCSSFLSFSFRGPTLIDNWGDYCSGVNIKMMSLVNQCPCSGFSFGGLETKGLAQAASHTHTHTHTTCHGTGQQAALRQRRTVFQIHSLRFHVGGRITGKKQMQHINATHFARVPFNVGRSLMEQGNWLGFCPCTAPHATLDSHPAAYSASPQRTKNFTSWCDLSRDVLSKTGLHNWIDVLQNNNNPNNGWHIAPT